MRISDWSSDVCSSDLAPFLVGSAHAEARVEQRIAVLRLLREQVRPGVVIAGPAAIDIDETGQPAAADVGGPGDAAGRALFGCFRQIVAGQQRSYKRRVGKECVSPCSVGWGRAHSKKTK